MKFPRNARIFRGQLDVAPFATVFFLLAIFLMLGSLVYTPGIRVQLPRADDLPGTDQPSISVAVDKNGQLYFENQSLTEADLRLILRQRAADSPKPLVLVIHADEAVSCNQLVRLSLLARQAHIYDALLATLPRPIETSAAQRAP